MERGGSRRLASDSEGCGGDKTGGSRNKQKAGTVQRPVKRCRGALLCQSLEGANQGPSCQRKSGEQGRTLVGKKDNEVVCNEVLL